MIKLYTAATPNGRKVSIALEELGVSYETVWVHLDKQEQMTPEFLAMNPNHKIPVLDDNGLILRESGAILVHLAEKHGKFLPRTPEGRAEALNIMFFQAAHVGPNLGRLGEQFSRADGDRNQEMMDVFLNETIRVFGVLETILSDGRDFLAGEYGVGDMMVYPWLRAARDAQEGFFSDFVKLTAWMDRVAARPAVARGMAVPH